MAEVILGIGSSHSPMLSTPHEAFERLGELGPGDTDLDLLERFEPRALEPGYHRLLMLSLHRVGFVVVLLCLSVNRFLLAGLSASLPHTVRPADLVAIGADELLPHERRQARRDVLLFGS